MPNQIVQHPVTLCPRFAFTINTEKSEIQSHLTQYLEWINTAAVSNSKKIILGNIIGYMSGVNIKNKRLLGMSTTDQSRYTICSNILLMGDLPDIFLMQYIINSLSGITTPNSTLRDNNLALVKQHMKLLMVPHLKETKKIGMGMFALAMMAMATGRTPTLLPIVLIMAGIMAITCSEPFVEYRIKSGLDDRLNAINARRLHINLEVAAPLDDDLQSTMTLAQDAAMTGIRLFHNFFNQQRARLDRIAEGYDPPRYEDERRRLG